MNNEITGNGSNEEEIHLEGLLRDLNALKITERENEYNETGSNGSQLRDSIKNLGTIQENKSTIGSSQKEFNSTGD